MGKFAFNQLKYANMITLEHKRKYAIRQTAAERRTRMDRLGEMEGNIHCLHAQSWHQHQRERDSFNPCVSVCVGVMTSTSLNLKQPLTASGALFAFSPLSSLMPTVI